VLHALLAIHCQRARSSLAASSASRISSTPSRTPARSRAEKHRRTRDLHARLFQREQMTGQVPAVDARNVLRIERARSVVSYQL
jgi:hypothetical protein